MIRCKLCHSTNCLRSYRVRKYQYFRCNICNTLFLRPFPRVQSIELLYKSFTYVNGLIDEQRIRKQSRKILSKLHTLNPKGKTLLDIGSGYGFFLDEANKAGLTTIGIEPSKKLVVQSIELLNRSIKVINKSFDGFYLKNLNKKYDFITLIHVIEHVTNPKKTILQALKLLKPQGILYIETPNLQSHLFNIEKEQYTFLTPPEHLWIFSIKSIEHVLNSYKLLATTYSYPEHLMGIIKKKLPILNYQLPINNKFQKINKKNNFNIKNLDLNIDIKFIISNLKLFEKTFKYTLFDKIISPILTPLLNLNGFGSILELYIKKK
jgi:2-polyprenyl-3-methyl-5-hydroxy-6-metoxy-1,4-benzoquinol methylase